ncbi:hypothetical protein Nepgr_014701 [Nepenthes gracilis]|uniref:Uncharacterized protein n=1 Tax=Nepenthes gracilis TaxID=150966 RepID=A0AAD3SJQ8_NEPGR|nr:hypothetical protein Nepgr_014701 [Nepenthes gracilis]
MLAVLLFIADPARISLGSWWLNCYVKLLTDAAASPRLVLCYCYAKLQCLFCMGMSLKVTGLFLCGWLADRGRLHQIADRLLGRFSWLWPISFDTCGRSHLPPETDLAGNFADLSWGECFICRSHLFPACNVDASADFKSAIWLVLPAFALCCVEPNAGPLWCADVGLVLTSWLLGFLGGVCVVALKLHPAACLFPEDVGNGGWCAAVPGIGVSAAFVAAAHKIYLELACYAVWVLTCNLQHRLGESPFYTCLAYGPFAGIDRLLDPAWNSLQK